MAANAPNVSVKGAGVIGHWEAAHKGVLRDFPPYKLPPDALYDCNNVIFRGGFLRPRPGLFNGGGASISGQDLGARVTGAEQHSTLASGAFEITAFENTAFLVNGNADATILTAATNKKWWAYFGGVWHDISGAIGLSATDTYAAQFTTIQIGTSIFVLLTNGLNTPASWDNVATTGVLVAGGSPLFTDWTTASDRIVGIVPPYLIQWGPALSISSWPALNNRILSDTNDILVAIENLGTLGVAVYKRRSIWIGTAQGGLDSSYFSFQLRGQFEGPACPNALINVNGAHYYITKTGRIGVFDGVTHTWINDGILPKIAGLIDIANMQRAFGHYDPINREVWFYYPLLTDNTSTTGSITGVIVVTLPHPFSYEGIFFHSCYAGQMAFSVTAGTDRRLDLGDRITFGQPTGADAGKNLAFTSADGVSDDGVAFTGFFQTPPQLTKDGDQYQADGVETYAMYNAQQGPLSLQIAGHKMLGDLTATAFTAGKALDLTIEPDFSPDIDFTNDKTRGRFFSLRYSFTSPSTFSFYGARLMGHKVQ